MFCSRFYKIVSVFRTLFVSLSSFGAPGHAFGVNTNALNTYLVPECQVGELERVDVTCGAT